MVLPLLVLLHREPLLSSISTTFVDLSITDRYFQELLQTFVEIGANKGVSVLIQDGF